MSNSPRETELLGFALARSFRKRRRHATVVALDGPLGAGKTTFAQGVFKAFGIRRRATSPTFILARRFPLSSRRTPFREFYHADLYRVRGAQGARAAGLYEALRSPEALILMEWARRARRMLPKDSVRVVFAHGRNVRERVIEIRHGERK